MTDKTNWLADIAVPSQLEFPFPPRPRVFRPSLCPRCNAVHASTTEVRQCAQVAREQA